GGRRGHDPGDALPLGPADPGGGNPPPFGGAGDDRRRILRCQRSARSGGRGPPRPGRHPPGGPLRSGVVRGALVRHLVGVPPPHHAPPRRGSRLFPGPRRTDPEPPASGGGARIGGAEGPRPLAHRRPVRHRLRLRGAVERALGAADRRGGTGRGAARGRSHPLRGESLMSPSTLGIAIAFAILFFFFLSGVRIVNEYENGVVFRLGRFSGGTRGGFRWLIPFIERMVIVDMRTVARDVPPQDVITRD